MREAFHEQLDAIFTELATMGDLVRTAVADATEALLSADAQIAERVISADDRLDSMRSALEEEAFAMLSLQQPVAGDLRVIVAALRMVTELERMGDLSVHVAKIARLRVPHPAVPEDARTIIEQMSAVAIDMVEQVTHIIRERDDAAAAKLRADDEQMDDLRRHSFATVLGDDWAHGVAAAVDIALLGRYYERIADHAVSVGNRVVYIVTGQAHVEGDE